MAGHIENFYDDVEGPEEESFYRPHRHVPSPPTSLTERDRPYLTHRPDRHTAEAFAKLSEMRSKNKLCDVVVKAGDLTLNAHRVVLAACSPYFNAMFSGGMKESQQGIVNFQSVHPKAIEALVDFCYLATVTVTMDNVQELLPASSLLQMHGVVDACCTFLASQLHPSNCLGIRQFSQVHSCSELWKKCCMFMQQRFPEIALHEEFLELSFQDLCIILSDGNLNVRGEEQVYEAGLTWIKHHLDDRKRLIADLLRCIRMPLMSATYLSREVHSESLVMDNFAGRGLLLEAMDHHLRKHYMRDSTNPQATLSTTPRHCPGLEYLFAIGGSGPPVSENNPFLDLCECYDVDKDEWRQVAPMNARRSGLRVASVGGYLFAIGGFSAVDTKALTMVDRYDPMTDSWRLVSPMNCARRSFGVATLNSCIYAIGGITCGTYHDSVEKYCPRSNRWTFVQPMGVERRAVCAASLEGYVYAAGESVCVCVEEHVYAAGESACVCVEEHVYAASESACVCRDMCMLLVRVCMCA